MAPPPHPPQDDFEQRARSVPYRSCYVTGVALCLFYYLFLVGAITALVVLVRERNPDPAPAIILATCALLAAVFWFLSYIKRRDATCPLCKGTPLLDTQALTHPKAVRYFPLNHGTSNILRIVTRQRFRCHFCGTPYDLLKEISPSRETNPQELQSLTPPDLPPAVIPPIAGNVPEPKPPTEGSAQKQTAEHR